MKARRIRSIMPVILLMFALSYGCASITVETRSLAPSPLPLVAEDMGSPKFWTEKLTDPSKVVMSAEEIAAFNVESLKSKVYLNEVLSLPNSLDGQEIKKKVGELLDWAKSRPFFGHDNYPLTDRFFAEMKSAVDLDAVPDRTEVWFGMTVRETDVRVIPNREIAMEAKDDYEFDYFQMSLLSLGTPLALLHKSKDGRWSYVVTPYVSGWVRSQDIAVAGKRCDIARYLGAEDFLVVTGPWAGVYSDRDLTRYVGRLRLGGRLPVTKKIGGVFEVSVPTRKFDGSLAFMPGYVDTDAPVSIGNPPYTQENLLAAAFSMLGKRYGWGGMYGFWDCSSYVRDVFGVFGFVLPRNSTSQSKVGVAVGVFDRETDVEEKYEVLRKAPPGITILRLPGHVMIYIGEVDGRHYVIHDTWGYRTKGPLGRSELKNVGRVVISELSLGERGKRGSLIERITHVVIIKGDEAGE